MTPEQDVFTNCVRDLYQWGSYIVTPLREPGFLKISEPRHTAMGRGVSSLVYAALTIDPQFDPTQDPKLRVYKEILNTMLFVPSENIQRALIIVADDVPLSVQPFSSSSWTPTNLRGSTPTGDVTLMTYFTRYSELERLIRKKAV